MEWKTKKIVPDPKRNKTEQKKHPIKISSGE
jgi:hypothetical protein